MDGRDERLSVEDVRLMNRTLEYLRWAKTIALVAAVYKCVSGVWTDRTGLELAGGILAPLLVYGLLHVAERWFTAPQA